MSSKLGMQIIGNMKQIVKEHPLASNIGIIFNPLLNFIRSAKRMCTDRDFRSIIFSQIFKPNKVHQTTSLTYYDRYPLIFSACRDYFNGKKDMKILSYGCSTGEEVLTLRKYFPSAEIIGVDINKNSLKVCRELNVDEKIKYLYSNNNLIKQHGPFDAIFCMAVFQRKPHYIAEKGISSLKKIYPFEKFESQIIELDKALKSEGIFIVHYTQYALLDTKLSSRYKVLGEYNQNDYKSPVFDRNSNLIENPTLQNSIFMKMHN